jgi:hypothetical protein
VWLALVLLLGILAPRGWSQALKFVDASQNPVTGYQIGTDSIFVLVQDAAADISAGASNDTTSLNHLDIPGLDTELSLSLTETTTPGLFFGPAGGFPLVFAVPVNSNGQIDAKDGDTLQAFYDPLGVNIITTVANTPTAATVRLLDSGGTDTLRYFLNTDTAILEVSDPDENRNPLVLDTLTANASVAPGGDSENLLLTETGQNTGIFRFSTTPVVGVGSSGNGVIEGTSGATLTLAFQDPDEAPPPAVDAASLLEITNSITKITDSAGTEVTTQGLPTSSLFVTVTDPDQNLDSFTQESVQVQLSSSITGDNLTLTLTETTNASGIFRNSTGVTVLQTATVNASNQVLETDHGATLTAAYTDSVRPADTSNDTVLAEVQEVASVLSLTNVSQIPQGFFSAPGDFYVRVADSDQNQSATSAETVQAQVTSSGLVGGDIQTVTLTETGNNTGIFLSIALPMVRSPSPSGENGTLEVLQGDTLTGSYIDPTNAGDSSNDSASINIVTAGTVDFIPSGNAGSNDYLLSEPVVVEVFDLDENQSHLVAEVLNLVVQVTAAGTSDIETLTLTETGLDTSLFRSDATMVSALQVATINNGTLEVVLPEALTVTYTDPNDATDIATGAGTVVANEALGTIAFTDASGNPDSLYYIGIEDIFVTVTDADENSNAATVQTIVAEVQNSTTGDVESLNLTETGVNTGTFRNTTGLASTILAVSPGNGQIEGADPSFVVANFTDPDTAVQISTSASMRVTQTASLTALTDSTGADKGIYRIGIDQIFVTVTDADENTRSDVAESLTTSVTLTNLTNGDIEKLTIMETGLASGVFRNTSGIPTSLPAGPITTLDGILTASDGDNIQAVYQDNDEALDTSADNAVMQFLTGSTVLITDSAGAQIDVLPFLNATDNGIHITVTDSDQNLDPLVQETVLATLRHVPAGAGEAMGGIVLTETTTSSGVFRTTTFILSEVGPITADAILQSFDGAQIQAFYTDPNDATDSASSNVATLHTTATNAEVVITSSPGSFIQTTTFAIGSDLVYVSVNDPDQDLSATSIESIQVNVLDLGTGDSVLLTLTEVDPDSGGDFTNFTGMNLAIGQNASDQILQTSHLSTFTANYTDPTPGDNSLTFDSAIAILLPTPESLVLTDGNGNPVNPFFIGVDQVFLTVTDPDENTNGNSVETSSLVTLTSDLGDSETLSLQETSSSTSVFRSTPGVPIVQAVVPIPGNGILEVNVGDQIIGTYEDQRDPGTTGATQGISFVDIPPVTSLTRFTDNASNIKASFLIGAGDIFVTVIDSDQNIDGSAPDTVVVTLTASITNDLETGVLLTETGANTGIFRNLTGIPSEIDVPLTFDNVLQLAGNSILTATYHDPDDATDISTGTATLQVPQVGVASFQITTDLAGLPAITPTTTVLIDTDLIFLVLEDLDQNTDPTTTETVNVALAGSAAVPDAVTITLVENGANSRFFVNDGNSFLASPVATATTGLASLIDPVNTANFLLETAHLEIIQATYTDPDSAGDTATTTFQMLVREDSSNTFFSDGSGAPRATYPIAPLDALERIFVTVEDQDENLSASLQESILVTLTDALTGDAETLALLETGNDTGFFRNSAGLNSILAVANLGDGILQTGDLSNVTATYQDSESSIDISTDTATMHASQGGATIRLTDQFGFDRSVYRMIPLTAENIFLTVTDADENKNPLLPDVVVVELESLFNGDTVLVNLTETGNSTGVFRNATGVVSLPGCFPITDNVVQGGNNQTLRATYTDTDDPFDTTFDLATLVNAPSFAAGFFDFIDTPASMTPVTTFLIEGSSGIYLSVSDADENEDPCVQDSVVVTITVNTSGDTESVTLTETTSSSGVFTGPTSGVPSVIDPPVANDGTLQVTHPSQLTAQYIDNDTIADQATAFSNSVMFEETGTCQFISDLTGTPLVGTIGIGTELIFVEVSDRDQDQDYAIQESLTVTVQSTGNLDIVTFTLLETANHTGIFRNTLPTPPHLVPGIPSIVATSDTTDTVLQTFDGDQALLTYIDPSNASDICTSLADMELKPTTSTAAFTDPAGTVRAAYSIQFDSVYVTVTDLDENANPTLAETITVQVTSLFPAPATQDVEIIDLTETGLSTGIFRNTSAPLPLEVGSALLGDGTLQTADGLDILATYTDADDASDISTSQARTFVASTNSTVMFTDDGLSSAVFSYFIGDNDIFVEVFDPDENVSPFSVQSVVVTVQVTSTGDIESFVLSEADDVGAGVFASTDSDYFRTTSAAPIPSVIASTGVPSNGVLEVLEGSFLTATYVDNDFPADTSSNSQSVVMRLTQTTSTLRVLNASLITTDTFLAIQDTIIVEVTDADQNLSPSVADSVVVTLETFDLAFDQETFTATEIAPNAGIFRTPPIASSILTPPAIGNSGNGVLDVVGDLPGGLGEDFVDVFYQDSNDGTDLSTGGFTITTQVDADILFTSATGVPVTTYLIGVDRIYVRLIDRDQNALVSTVETAIVTVTDQGTGDFETLTLQETSINSGVFFNTGGIASVFDLTAIPGDGVLQTGDPSSTTAEAEYQDPDDALDNPFVSVQIVPLDPNDRDGDGIPNSIETANGLDPNDPADAVQDNDLDGRNNRTELVIDFTDPNDDTDNAPVPVITPLNTNVDPGVIRLDGSASFDQTTKPPSIGIISYLWSQVGNSPAVVTLSSISSPQPFFVARTPGTYTIQLTVTDADGAVRSSTSNITVNDLNPVADPGPGGSMRINGTGTAIPAFPLDGSKSEDPNAQTLTYLWSSGPGNEVGAIVFDNANSATPKILTVAGPGRAVVRLTVTDTSFQSNSRDVVILVHDDQSGVPSANHTPTADAGEDQTVTAGPGVIATLRGELSSDQDGEVLSLSAPPVLGDLGWIYLGGPPTGAVAGATLLNAVATGLSQVGVYTFGLRVRDTHAGGAGVAVSDQDLVRIIAQTPTNHVPTANAGGPYNFNPLIQVQLDGSGSGDADVGDTLTYLWTQIGGISTALDDPTVQSPTLTFYDSGVYRYQLVVTDAAGNTSIPSVATMVVGFPGDNPPVANAGVDQVGSTGNLVLLDGSLSSDVDLQPLTYFWRQISGTQLLLSDRRSANPSFTPTRAGTYRFELVVEDGHHFSPPASVTISIDPPVANAGPDQNLFLGAGGTAVTVTLDGSGSFDPTPGPQALSFAWSQVGGPTVTLSSNAASGPTFQTLVAGTYQFLLVVDDGQARSAELNQNNGQDSFVKIVISQASDTIPTADAGPDQFVNAGSVVTLDGSASFDADGNAVSYLWTQVTGIPVLLVPGAAHVSPSFIPSVGGSAYTFRLTVSDPGGKQSTDSVTIFATGGQTGSGAGNPLPSVDPAVSAAAFAESGGGGGCDARPAWIRGGVQEHWAQVLLNLLMFLLPLLSLLDYRQRVVVAGPQRSSVRLVRRE